VREGAVQADFDRSDRSGCINCLMSIGIAMRWLLFLGVVVAPKSGESLPNKEALFCVLSAQTAIGLTGVSPAFDGTTIPKPHAGGLVPAKRV